MLQNTFIKVILPLTAFINVIGIAYGQEKRVFNFSSEEVPYYHSANFNLSGFSVLPNLNAKIIIVNNQENLLFDSDSIKNAKNKIVKKDYLLSYYLKLPKLDSETEYLDFLRSFIEENYYQDAFNRNTISIAFEQNTIPFSCESLDDLNTFIAKVLVPENSSLLNCDKSYVSTKNIWKEKLKTSMPYDSIIFISEAEKLREDYKLLKSLSKWENTFFVALKLGHYEISKKQRTAFDEETLVDFSNLKTAWNIDVGNMFSQKIGGFLNVGLSFKKEEEINRNGSNIRVTGNGAGVIKIGLGVKYIPFTKDRWSLFTDLAIGRLRATAGGGSGNINISTGNNSISLKRKTEKSRYLNFSLGSNYRLGRIVFLTSNLQYSINNFENKIGSVSGLSGYSINIGLGFSF